MIKDIKYSGYSAVPSDYECPDGELAVAINLIPEDGALKPIPSPAKVEGISLAGASSVYIHKTSVGDNYIELHLVHDDFSARAIWIGKDGNFFSVKPHITDFGYEGITQIISVTSVGDILIFSTDNGIYYARYMPGQSHYVFMGKIPDIKLNVGLKLNFTTQLYESLPFEIIESTGSRSDTIEWTTLASSAYRASPDDGVSTPFNGSSETLTSGKFYFEGITLRPSVEYKFTWRIITNTGRVASTTIALFGRKADESSHSQITGSAGKQSSQVAEMLFTLSAEYTDVYYVIHYQNNSAYPGTQQYITGNTVLYQGVEHQPSGDATTEIKYTSDAYSAIMEAFNKFIADKAHNHAQFIYPFFLRYAIRMFDGSYAKISEPICLVPNSGYVPAAGFSSSSMSGTHLQLSAYIASIRYQLATEISDAWSDVIDGIDIFISKPIWAYSQGENYDASKSKFRFKSRSSSKGIGAVYVAGTPSDNDGLRSYYIHPLEAEISRYAQSSYTTNFIEIAPRTSEEIREDVSSLSPFYLVASLTLETLKGTFGTDDLQDMQLDIENIGELYGREPFDDNILPYEGFSDAKLSTYNSRLNISGGSSILPTPSAPSCISSYIGGIGTITTCVYINTSEGIRTVISDNVRSSYSTPWFFYPDSKAYKVQFLMRNEYGGIIANYERELKPHDMLNGAYWFSDDFLGPDFSIIESQENTLAGVSVNNKCRKAAILYVSEVNNPFVFRASNNVAISANEILATASAAKALSQGQFGQFPLYAFTDEGVWAMEVGADGSYTARQPITRDVCINAEGITQIDSAVLFPTSRGIMLLSGSNCTCISDNIRSETPFDLHTLPHATKLHAMLGHDVAEESCLAQVPLTEFLKDCRIIYDYIHQRIIVYNSNPNIKYAYVYSLKSQLWGMIYTTVVNNINSYPNALAITDDGSLVDFSIDPVDSEQKRQLLITRPIKLEAPDVLKTMDTVIQRGHFQKGHVQAVLYASRDLYNWHLIWSSKDHYLRGFRGTPYKYFRIACVTSLSEDESIFGASLQFTPRLTDQPR